jgi:hypothetical protein
MLPVVFGPLGLTLKETGDMTPYELINIYHGWLWRQERSEERLCRFVTLPIHNTAGRVNKKPLTMRDCFKDGRFRKKETMDDFLQDFDG